MNLFAPPLRAYRRLRLAIFKRLFGPVWLACMLDDAMGDAEGPFTDQTVRVDRAFDRFALRPRRMRRIVRASDMPVPREALLRKHAHG